MHFLRRQKCLLGFSLVELLIVVAIAILLTVVGMNAFNKSVTQSTVDSAAKSLASDLSYARSAAILKGCKTRIIFCGDKDCSLRTMAASGNFIVTNGTTEPARFYAILRETTPCSSDSGVASTSDNYTNWDYDRRPQDIPDGLAFSAIYSGTNGLVNADNGTVASNVLTAPGNSLWFSSSGIPANGTIPITGDSATATGAQIVFQIRPETCSPKDESACIAYFVTLDKGQAGYQRCVAGTGTRAGDVCF